MINLSFSQNDYPIGESFWPKDSLITHTFWTMPIMPSLLFFWTHFMYIKKGFIYSKMPFHKFSTSETLNDDSIHKKKIRILLYNCMTERISFPIQILSINSRIYEDKARHALKIAIHTSNKAPILKIIEMCIEGRNFAVL